MNVIAEKCLDIVWSEVQIGTRTTWKGVPAVNLRFFLFRFHTFVAFF